MDDETRRAVDAACLRLLGWGQITWAEGTQCFTAVPPGAKEWEFAFPSRDPALVVPLAKALRALGWHVTVRSCWLSDQWAVQLLHGKWIIDEYADTMPLALALAAARAAGERSEE